MRAATNLVALVVVLPAASALLLRYYTNNQKDLWLARMTGLLLVIGSFTIAFAVNPFIMAIGTSIPIPTFYHLLTHVPRSHSNEYRHRFHLSK